MADNGSPALNTQIESGNFDEKERAAAPAPAKPKVEDDEDEDEDIDALIEDLESQDGHGEDEEDEERDQHGGRVIPEELLQTVSLCKHCPSSTRIFVTLANTSRAGYPHWSY